MMRRKRVYGERLLLVTTGVKQSGWKLGRLEDLKSRGCGSPSPKIGNESCNEIGYKQIWVWGYSFILE